MSAIRAGNLAGLRAAIAIQLAPEGNRISAQVRKALFAQRGEYTGA
jgi:hypothetical protein